MTPLHFKWKEKESKLNQPLAWLISYIQFVQYLIEKGANIVAKQKDQWTSLNRSEKRENHTSIFNRTSVLLSASNIAFYV